MRFLFIYFSTVMSTERNQLFNVMDSGTSNTGDVSFACPLDSILQQLQEVNKSSSVAFSPFRFSSNLEANQSTKPESVSLLDAKDNMDLHDGNLFSEDKDCRPDDLLEDMKRLDNLTKLRETTHQLMLEKTHLSAQMPYKDVCHPDVIQQRFTDTEERIQLLQEIVKDNGSFLRRILQTPSRGSLAVDYAHHRDAVEMLDQLMELLEGLGHNVQLVEQLPTFLDRLKHLEDPIMHLTSEVDKLQEFGRTVLAFRKAVGKTMRSHTFSPDGAIK
uniref:uncharacterized protein n=1 Tax=Myxine glutinosa TaxID=7769 RepID=UPI00358F5129